jgi:hypothetical protein
MLQVGFEITIPANKRPQTHALERAATGIGLHVPITKLNFMVPLQLQSSKVFRYHDTLTSLSDLDLAVISLEACVSA